MVKKTFYCDCCGKEITDGERFFRLCTAVVNSRGDGLDFTHGAELCAECYERIDGLIARAVQQGVLKEEATK